MLLLSLLLLLLLLLLLWRRRRGGLLLRLPLLNRRLLLLLLGRLLLLLRGLLRGHLLLSLRLLLLLSGLLVLRNRLPKRQLVLNWRGHRPPPVCALTAAAAAGIARLRRFDRRAADARRRQGLGAGRGARAAAPQDSGLEAIGHKVPGPLGAHVAADQQEERQADPQHVGILREGAKPGSVGSGVTARRRWCVRAACSVAAGACCWAQATRPPRCPAPSRPISGQPAALTDLACQPSVPSRPRERRRCRCWPWYSSRVAPSCAWLCSMAASVALVCSSSSAST